MPFTMKQLFKALKGIVMGVHITEVNPHIPERREIRIQSTVIPESELHFNDLWKSISAQCSDYQRYGRV